MKKFFNKALIYKEWKNVFWFVLLCTGMLAIIKYDDMNGLISLARHGAIADESFTHYNKMVFDSGNMQVLYVIGEILLSFVIFGTDRRKNYYKLSAMPFTRKEIINSKVAISIISLLIIFTASFIVLITGYFYNFEVLSKYFQVGLIFRWWSINLLTSISTVVFLALIQSVTGNAIVGCLLGTISMAIPYLLYNIFYYLRKTFSFVSQFSVHNSIKGINWSTNMNIFEKIIANMSFSSYNIRNYNDVVNTPSLDNLGYTLSIIILIVVIILFYLLLIYSFQKNPLDKTGYVFLFKPVENVFKVGFPICLALIIICFIISGTLFKVKYTIGFYSLLAFGFIMSMIIIAFVTNRVVDVCKK